MVGIGRGAQAGVLVKSAGALEGLEKASVLVVDKTGTLTEGRPKLTEVRAVAGQDPSVLLAAAAAAERASEHPLAAAIVAGARERGALPGAARDFQSTTGGGVSATVGENRVLVGQRAFLENAGVHGIEVLVADGEALQRDGQTVVFVSIGGELAGLLAVSDPIKAAAADSVRELRALGLSVVMLTGDNAATAQAVATKLGITEVEAGVAPADKQTRVRSLRDGGKIVAMAGDGINDAPALAAADVGIAMGTGTDVAIESAGITLLKGDLRGLVRAVRLSRALMRNVRQNLFFAFFYNALGIPLAAGVLYPWTGTLLSPMIAGAAMSLSSLCVIGNALRLRAAKLEA
jgi:Cu+-exporting ATPase